MKKQIEEIREEWENLKAGITALRKSRIAENGKYLGKFEIYGNNINSVEKAIIEAEQNE